MTRECLGRFAPARVDPQKVETRPRAWTSLSSTFLLSTFCSATFSGAGGARPSVLDRRSPTAATAGDRNVGSGQSRGDATFEQTADLWGRHRANQSTVD